MPNSRMEIATVLNDDVLEALGAWTTDGNLLIGGGGQLLGSRDFFGFNFITNNIVRGGFRDTGEFFLAEGSLNPQSQYIHQVKNAETNNNTPLTVFQFNIPDNRVFKFHADINFITEDGLTWGNLERKITARREGALADSSKETFNYTERFGDTSIDAYWERSGNLVELKVRGVTGQPTFFSAFIKYFGA
jgi:hypothetical protein